MYIYGGCKSSQIMIDRESVCVCVREREREADRGTDIYRKKFSKSRIKNPQPLTNFGHIIFRDSKSFFSRPGHV